MKRRALLKTIPVLCAAPAFAKVKSKQPNIILFTVDDMDVTSVNCYGQPLPNLTPNMDKLAAQGMRFMNAHVNSPICMPC